MGRYYGGGGGGGGGEEREEAEEERKKEKKNEGMENGVELMSTDKFSPIQSNPIRSDPFFPFCFAVR